MDQLPKEILIHELFSYFDAEKPLFFINLSHVSKYFRLCVVEILNPKKLYGLDQKIRLKKEETYKKEQEKWSKARSSLTEEQKIEEDKVFNNNFNPGVGILKLKESMSKGGGSYRIPYCDCEIGYRYFFFPLTLIPHNSVADLINWYVRESHYRGSQKEKTEITKEMVVLAIKARGKSKPTNSYDVMDHQSRFCLYNNIWRPKYLKMKTRIDELKNWYFLMGATSDLFEYQYNCLHEILETLFFTGTAKSTAKELCSFLYYLLPLDGKREKVKPGVAIFWIKKFIRIFIRYGADPFEWVDIEIEQKGKQRVSAVGIAFNLHPKIFYSNTLFQNYLFQNDEEKTNLNRKIVKGLSAKNLKQWRRFVSESKIVENQIIFELENSIQNGVSKMLFEFIKKREKKGFFKFFENCSTGSIKKICTELKNENEETLLIVVCKQRGRLEHFANILLKLGSDINAQCKNKETCVMKAIKKNNVKLINMMLKKFYRDINFCDVSNKEGKNVIDLFQERKWLSKKVNFQYYLKIVKENKVM